MTVETSSLSEIVQDLVYMNYDRAESYERLVHSSLALNDEVRTLLSRMADACRDNVMALVELEGSVRSATDTTDHHGELHNSWIRSRQVLTPGRPKLLLSNCLVDGYSALEVYKSILCAGELNNNALRQLLMDQKYLLQSLIDKLVKSRDLLDLRSIDNFRPAINITSNFINTKAG